MKACRVIKKTQMSQKEDDSFFILGSVPMIPSHLYRCNPLRLGIQTQSPNFVSTFFQVFQDEAELLQPNYTQIRCYVGNHKSKLSSKNLPTRLLQQKQATIEIKSVENQPRTIHIFISPNNFERYDMLISQETQSRSQSIYNSSARKSSTISLKSLRSGIETASTNPLKQSIQNTFLSEGAFFEIIKIKDQRISELIKQMKLREDQHQCEIKKLQCKHEDHLENLNQSIQSTLEGYKQTSFIFKDEIKNLKSINQSLQAQKRDAAYRLLQVESANKKQYILIESLQQQIQTQKVKNQKEKNDLKALCDSQNRNLNQLMLQLQQARSKLQVWRQKYNSTVGLIRRGLGQELQL